MKITIPAAHGEAIAERMQIMRQLAESFQILKNEDARHTNAVIRTAGLSPDDYSQYSLERDGENYLLSLTEKAKETPAAPPLAEQTVNGAPAVQ